MILIQKYLVLGLAPGPGPGPRTVYFWTKIMEFDPKWVHMARYELILRQDGAIWLRIILKPLLTPKGAIKDPKNPKKVLKSLPSVLLF